MRVGSRVVCGRCEYKSKVPTDSFFLWRTRKVGALLAEAFKPLAKINVHDALMVVLEGGVSSMSP